MFTSALSTISFKSSTHPFPVLRRVTEEPGAYSQGIVATWGGRHPRWRANPTNRLHIHTLGVHMSLDWGRNPEERGGHANSTHAWRRPWRSEATVLTTKSPCPLISHQSCFGYIVLQSTAKKQKILQDASRVPI